MILMVNYDYANIELLRNIPEIIEYLEVRVAADKEPFRNIPDLVEYLEVLKDPNKDISAISQHTFYSDIFRF